MKLNHIAIIVSTEEGINFYKSLGFFEISREIRINQHDELIYMKSENLILEIYKDSTHPQRISKPEAYGLRHLCFEVDDIGDEYKIDNKGKFKFIFDPDGLPIEIRELKK